MFNSFSGLADAQLSGATLSREDALAVLRSGDDVLMDLVAAAARLRRAHFGNTVKANYLVNLKSGLCPEDCSYCSQRLGSDADIVKYGWLKPEEAVEQANHGIGAGATRVCLVSSGRGPSNRDVERVGGIVGALKEEHPELEVCACLGLLKEGQAERLREAGVDAYNHNVNTAESRYDEICTTHSYADRVDTVAKAKGAGLSPCSGLIVGMGETDEELVDAIFALRDIGADSIPVNFLMPFEGTPFSERWELTPARCLRILALCRLAAPATELRIAGGREMHLRSMQPVALQIANSIFLGDYLTSEGQATADDLAMIADAGLVVLGQEDAHAHAQAAHAHAHGQAADDASCAHSCGGCSGGSEGGCGGHDARNLEEAARESAERVLAAAVAGDASTSGLGGHEHAPVRRRGAGTELAPNA